MNIKNKTVFITGANGGIGQAIITSLINRGAKKIYASARNTDLLKAIVEKYNDIVIPVCLDITDSKQVEQISKKYCDIDILINNAGLNTNSCIKCEGAVDSLKKEVEVNLFGTLNMFNAFKTCLIKKEQGVIVNVCSILSYVNMPMNGTYSISKAATHSLTQAMRGELAKYNINVIGVYPGPVDTRMTEGLEMPKATPNSVAEEIVKGIELKVNRVMPDDFSKGLYKNILKSYEDVEKEMENLTN